MTYLFVCCCSGLTATATADAVNAELFEMAQNIQEVIQARTMSGSSAGSVRYGDIFGVLLEIMRRRTPQERLEYRQRRSARREAGDDDRGESFVTGNN